MKTLTRQRGLTLIELLVTVVILSFTVALMSGAFGQIAQMMRISTEHSNGFLGRWNQSRALHDMVGNMVIDPTQEQPFTGRPERLEMVTLAIPDGPPGVPRPARLLLKPTDDGQEGTDLLLDTSTSRGSSAALRLTRFPGRLEFRYVDQQGEEHLQWPPAGITANRPMPSGVVLRDTSNQRTIVRAAAFEGDLQPKNNAIAQAFGLGR